MARIVVMGNAGSGKTTMARILARQFDLVHLCLDDIAWIPAETPTRRPLPESVDELTAFMATNPSWVVEGCYGDLIEAALPQCTELRFLNPGVDVCIRNARQRPWEPSYCESPEKQQEYLGPLIEFIREYESRTDEFSLSRHRQLFDEFPGAKREFVDDTWLE